jgi:prolyl 4-hydroxylase
MNNIYQNKIFTITDFLSDIECDTFIDNINNKTKIVNFTSASQFKNDKYIDDKLANSFYDKIKQSFGNELIDKLHIIDVNNLIMTGRYNASQQFNLHTDTGLYFNKKNKIKSRYTLLIYLNDNYNGGETGFFDDDFSHIIDIKPKKGMALLFDINMWHKGNLLLNNNKYWIGCEIKGRY